MRRLELGIDTCKLIATIRTLYESNIATSCHLNVILFYKTWTEGGPHPHIAHMLC